MPVQIGAKSHTFSDPIGLLSDCHRRIEMFLGALLKVAVLIDHEPDAETRRALENAMRYFRESGPRHTADEEESLFPRLRKLQCAGLQQAMLNMESLENEHKLAERLHAEVDRLGAKYLDLGQLAPPEVGAFRDAVSQLSSMYREHIRLEDEVLFQFAAKMLPESDKNAVSTEMAARRKVSAEGKP